MSYDAVGRITGFGNGAVGASFSYDANGNRLGSVHTTGAGTATQTISRSYSVDAQGNRLLGFQQTSSGPGGGAGTSIAYQYSANGDLLSDGLRRYGYDAAGRLSSVTTGTGDGAPTTRYAYNALGQRVFKTEPLYPDVQGSEQDEGFLPGLMAFFARLWNPQRQQAEQLGWAYVYGEDGSLLGEYGTGGAQSTGAAKYIYLPTANGALPIAAVMNGRKLAIHADHLNTPRRLSLANGKAVWQWAYSAFGEEAPTLGRNRFANPEQVPSAGTTSLPEVEFNLRYPGQYADKESGLFYNYFRSYSPTTGRYSQPDPIGLSGGWNRNAYALNSALNYTDPSGLIVGVDDLAVGGLVVTTGCLLSQGCRGMIGTAMSTAADAAGSAASAAVSAVKSFCSPGAPDPCKGLRDQLNAHEKKLQDYVNNPLGPSDNTSILNWAVLGGNGAAASSIYEGRIRNLKGQIENFRRLLQDCERKNGRP